MLEKSAEKGKAKKPSERAEKFDLEKFVGRIDQTIEKFVDNSNKMWAKIKGQIAAEQMGELTEKQKALETEGYDGFANKFSKIEEKFKENKKALEMAGRAADIAIFGIGIALFLIRSETQLVGTMNEFLRTKTRWVACRLIKSRPMFDQFMWIIERFGQRFNLKCRGKAEIVDDIMGNVKSLLGQNSEFQSGKKKRQKLVNMDIYVRYLNRIDEKCRPFYANAFLDGLPTLKNLFCQIRFFIQSTANQFSIFKHVAETQGFEVMKQRICE
ncbi:hypothetical protein niasHT_039847 [Heterodera trifolii]|uniref:Uncharacterized protein n=1 Tax=Heterodera trifolii TaxID=157864 RepID=A0ABD2IUT1_9BILA